MTPNFKELNAGKRCATLMDTFHDLERVHDHLIDNLNLEILELEIWSKLYGRRNQRTSEWQCVALIGVIQLFSCSGKISIMNHLKLVQSVDRIIFNQL